MVFKLLFETELSGPKSEIKNTSFVLCLKTIFFHFREELKRWFTQQEVDFFRYRLSNTADADKRSFLITNNLHYEPVRLYFISLLHSLACFWYITITLFTEVYSSNVTLQNKEKRIFVDMRIYHLKQ